VTPQASSVPSQGEDSRGKAAEISQDDWDILNARVEEQRQTKVESGAKYRLKLSGLALFNAFGNFGQVDAADLPSISTPPQPSLFRWSRRRLCQAVDHRFVGSRARARRGSHQRRFANGLFWWPAQRI